MTIVTPPHHHYSRRHLAAVVEAMLQLGPPRIRAFFDPATGAWFAREGTHRLRAARLLGVAPVLIPIPWWRSRAALVRARFAACLRGHEFPAVRVERTERLPHDERGWVPE